MDKFENSTREQPQLENAPLDMTGEEFRRVGHKLVDQIATFLDGIRSRKVQSSDAVAMAQQFLGDQALPSKGLPAEEVMNDVSSLLIEKSLLTAHPRFWCTRVLVNYPDGFLCFSVHSTTHSQCVHWHDRHRINLMLYLRY